MKEVAWGIKFHTVRLDKLKDKFYDVLEFVMFTVKAMKTTSYLTTFSFHKISDFLQKSIKTFSRCSITRFLKVEPRQTRKPKIKMV